jgi:hypothetical protein
MLIFKKNIHRKNRAEESPVLLSRPYFNPYEFVKNSLTEELDLLHFLEKQPLEYRKDDLVNFYPNAHKCINWLTLIKMLHILTDGLESKEHWYAMNTYHFCVLYDILNRNAFNYNHDTVDEKLLFLPTLQGESFDFKQFIQDYFYNRVFLLEANRYNELSQSEKQRMGFTCPCQFGVINGLLPNSEELRLSKSEDFPYTLCV